MELVGREGLNGRQNGSGVLQLLHVFPAQEIVGEFDDFVLQNKQPFFKPNLFEVDNMDYRHTIMIFFRNHYRFS